MSADQQFTQPVILDLQRKGGTGKTMLACALAAFYHERHQPCHLIDCDLGGGDLVNKHLGVTRVGFDRHGQTTVMGVLNATEPAPGLPAILDFGANTNDVAEEMIDRILKSKSRVRRPVFIVPFDNVEKSRIGLLEIMLQYPDEQVIGAAVVGDTGMPPVPKDLPADRLLVIPRLSKRIAEQGYDLAAKSLLDLSMDGQGVVRTPSKHNMAAIATRSFLREIFREFSKFERFILPQPINPL